MISSGHKVGKEKKGVSMANIMHLNFKCQFSILNSQKF